MDINVNANEFHTFSDKLIKNTVYYSPKTGVNMISTINSSRKPWSKTLTIALAFSFGIATLSACTPSVQVALPNEPININLNVKIQHEILIKIDKQLDNMFSETSGLF